jgi:hypothetical protein
MLLVDLVSESSRDNGGVGDTVEALASLPASDELWSVVVVRLGWVEGCDAAKLLNGFVSDSGETAARASEPRKNWVAEHTVI